MKKIVFVLNINDWLEFYKVYDDYLECITYQDTEEAIKQKKNNIMTTSIIHCTKKLMDEYEVELFYKDKMYKLNENKTIYDIINNNV